MNRSSLMLLPGIALLALLVLVVGGEEIRPALTGLSSRQLTALLLIQVVTLTLGSYQWYYLLKKRAGATSFGQVLAIHLCGNFVESVTPAGRLGGEAAKVYLFQRVTRLPYDQLAGLLAVRKYVSMLPFFALCALSLTLSLRSMPLPPVVYGAFLLLAAGFALACRLWLHLGRREPERSGVGVGGWLPRVIGQGLRRAAAFLRHASASSQGLLSRRERRVLMLPSLLIWLLYPATVYLAGRFLGYGLAAGPAFMGAYSAYLIGLVPLFPGGLGTFEGGMTFVLSGLGLSPAQGLAIALVTRLATYWFPLALSAAATGLVLAGGHVPGLRGAILAGGTGIMAGAAPPGRAVLPERPYRTSKTLERFGAAHPPFGALYGRALYRRLVAGEARAAGIVPGMRVLHVGCGALPMTAIYLAGMGCRVTAVDQDPGCVRLAAEAVSRRGLAGRVTVTGGDGLDVDAAPFAAVWVSVQVRPKAAILRRLLGQLRPGSPLIYRNPRGWARRLYPAEAACEPEALGSGLAVARLEHRWGKESVVVRRTPG